MYLKQLRFYLKKDKDITYSFLNKLYLHTI